MTRQVFSGYGFGLAETFFATFLVSAFGSVAVLASAPLVALRAVTRDLRISVGQEVNPQPVHRFKIPGRLAPVRKKSHELLERMPGDFRKKDCHLWSLWPNRSG